MKVFVEWGLHFFDAFNYHSYISAEGFNFPDTFQEGNVLKETQLLRSQTSDEAVARLAQILLQRQTGKLSPLHERIHNPNKVRGKGWVLSQRNIFGVLYTRCSFQ